MTGKLDIRDLITIGDEGSNKSLQESFDQDDSKNHGSGNDWKDSNHSQEEPKNDLRKPENNDGKSELNGGNTQQASASQQHRQKGIRSHTCAPGPPDPKLLQKPGLGGRINQLDQQLPHQINTNVYTVTVPPQIYPPVPECQLYSFQPTGGLPQTMVLPQPLDQAPIPTSDNQQFDANGQFNATVMPQPLQAPRDMSSNQQLDANSQFNTTAIPLPAHQAPMPTSYDQQFGANGQFNTTVMPQPPFQVATDLRFSQHFETNGVFNTTVCFAKLPPSIDYPLLLSRLEGTGKLFGVNIIPADRHNRYATAEIVF
ncbi:hypothetical protein GGR58DRAFT_452005 [Xylaria digitata]|nr:hypothetical protein GGR58DRAFT_452005 [Xylaria digitata]